MLAIASLVLAQNMGAPSILPKPVLMQAQPGTFTFNADTRIVVPRELEEVGNRLQEALRPGTGLRLDLTNHGGGNAIVLRLDRKLQAMGSEGYQLDAKPDQVLIRAYAPAGLFYGIQSLRQMLPADSMRKGLGAPRTWSVPCVHIEDQPRFAWRGAMLDVSRHFEPKAFLFKFIDELALHKMNTFHIHLTDDQGWRMQIKKYPKLTEIGAWHKPNQLSDDPTTYKVGADKAITGLVEDGGYYTQDDLREVVAYAKARYVTMVPEIEMPGHSFEVVCAYPELGNGIDPKRLVTPGVNDPTPDVLNASAATVKVYQDILTEVMDVFPSTFIHVGGDEVNKSHWHNNPVMQAQMKELGLKSEEELQSWFIQQMDKFIASKGRRLIGWDEILEGGLAPGATVMSWRGIEGGIAAAKANHDVVMAPTSHTYLDYYQASDRTHEPRAIGGYVPLQKVYSFEPVPSELTADQAKHILGAQGQLWTEYIPNAAHVEYMAFPRLCALAEVDWSPKASRNYDDFLGRLRVHLDRLKMLDVNFRPLEGSKEAAVAGWKSGEMSQTFTTHSWDVTSSISGPGVYRAIYNYTDGDCRLDIAWSELLEDAAVVARDEHVGHAGDAEVDNVYTLKLASPKPNSRYTLRASVRADGGTDSVGDIFVKKAW